MAKTQTFTAGFSSVGGFGYADRFTLYVKLTDRDGDSSTNQSTVDYEVYFENTSGGGTFTSKTRLAFYLNGEKITDSTLEITAPRNGKYWIASGSKTFTHDGDGSKTIGFQAIVSSTNFGISSSITDNFSLEKIARYFSSTPSISIANRTLTSISFTWSTSEICDKIDYNLSGTSKGEIWTGSATSGTLTINGLSPNTTYSIYIWCRRKDSQLGSLSSTISATTYDIARITSAPNFNDENNPTITYTNPFGNNVGELQACISWTGGADISYRDIDKTGTSYTFNFSQAEREKLWKAATSNTLTVRFYITTYYNGETYYSIAERTLTIVNANPIFSNFTYSDVDSAIVALTGNNQTIVRGYSNVYGVVSVANKASAIKYASMNKYRLSIGSQTKEAWYSETSDVGIELYNIDSNTFTMYAIDSRGNSTAKQIMASNYIDYSPIKVTSISATRTDSVKQETTLTFSGYFWNGNFGAVQNAIMGSHYKYRIAGTTEWKGQTELGNFTINGNHFSFTSKISGDLGAEGFDINNSYEISVAIMDKLSGDDSARFILGPGTPAIAIYKNRLAIGQRYDINTGGALQVKGTSVFWGNLWLYGRMETLSNTLALNSTGQTGDAVFYELWKNSSRAGWIGFGNNNSNVLWISNQTGDKVYVASSLEWERGYASNVDANGYGTSGTWYFTTGCSNMPTSYCTLFVNGNGTSTDTSQIATYVSTGQTWVRGRSNGTWHPWLHLLGKQILYYNTSGTTGSITLDETAANFDFMEIFYRNDWDEIKSDTVYVPNGKTFQPLVCRITDTVDLKSARFTISGTTITRNVDYNKSWTSWNNTIQDSTGINVIAVVGFK